MSVAKESKVSALTSPFWISVEALHTLIRTCGYTEYRLTCVEDFGKIYLNLVIVLIADNPKTIEAGKYEHVAKLSNHLGYRNPVFTRIIDGNFRNTTTIDATWDSYPLQVRLNWIEGPLVRALLEPERSSDGKYYFATSTGEVLGY